jgi:uncharacterized protein
MFAGQTKALTDEELDRLGDFLDHASDMNIEALDGFFCALVSGPDLVLPSEYFPEIWGEGPAFADETEAREIIELLMRHWNAVASALMASLDETQETLYLPILHEDGDGIALGNDWASGFMHGVRMREESWSDFMDDKDHSMAMLPIIVLQHENDPDPALRPPPLSVEDRRELLSGMVIGLAYIYRHFARLRSAPSRVPSAPKRSPRRRTSTKVRKRSSTSRKK